MGERRRLAGTVASLAVIGGLLAGGCTPVGPNGTPVSAQPSGVSGTPLPSTGPSTQAAGLRADLTLTLRQHVDLNRVALSAVLDHGSRSRRSEAAITRLDQNTKALGKIVRLYYGTRGQEAFVKQWRRQNAAYLTYAKGVAGKRPAVRADARKQLRDSTAELAAFLAAATQGSERPYAADLTTHTANMTALVDDLAARKPAAATALVKAENHMDTTALLYTRAVVGGKALAGDPASRSSTLLATLTGRLQQHAALTTFVAATAADSSFRSPRTKAASAALRENTAALATVFGHAYGDDARTKFAARWKEQVGYFDDRLAADLGRIGPRVKPRGHRKPPTRAATTRHLEGWTVGFATFLAGYTGRPAPELQAGLDRLVRTTRTALDDSVPPVQRTPDAVADAGVGAAALAPTLAEGVAATVKRYRD